MPCRDRQNWALLCIKIRADGYLTEQETSFRLYTLISTSEVLLSQQDQSYKSQGFCCNPKLNALMVLVVPKIKTTKTKNRPLHLLFDDRC